MALRSPWVLVAGPTLAWRWIGTNRDYWDTNWYYSLIVMPIVFIAGGAEHAAALLGADVAQHRQVLPDVAVAGRGGGELGQTYRSVHPLGGFPRPDMGVDSRLVVGVGQAGPTWTTT